MVYAKRALRDRCIPFDITAPVDPFYSKANMSQIKKAVSQVEAGKVFTKTLEELETLADE